MRLSGAIVGAWFRIGTVVANVLVLNLIWIACSLPVVTILPSFAALFGTIHHWSETGEEAVFSTYFQQWRRHARRSYTVGLPLLAMTIILAFESGFYFRQHDVMSILMLALVISCSFLVLSTAVYLWPLMVSVDCSVPTLWRTAFVHGVRFSPRSLVTVLPVWLLAVVLVLWAPVALFIGVIPLSVWLTYLSVHKVIIHVKEGAIS